MLFNSMFFFFLFVCVPILIYRAYKRFCNKNKLGIDGKLIWIDHGENTKPFFNNLFKVFGKPDLMYMIKGGVLAVEYKNRNSTIYNSDIVQARTAALAARGAGYNVIQVLVKTNTKERYFTLPKNDIDLFKEVEHYINLTRQAKAGCKLKASPALFKCRFCAYRNLCEYAQ